MPTFTVTQNRHTPATFAVKDSIQLKIGLTTILKLTSSGGMKMDSVRFAEASALPIVGVIGIAVIADILGLFEVTMDFVLLLFAVTVVWSTVSIAYYRHQRSQYTP